MLIRAKGSSSGIKEYLEKGQMKDRFYDRNQLDKRMVLSGDLELVDDIINNLENNAEKFFHYTLSFKEDSIDEDIIRKVTQEFREFYFKAYNDDELCFYAEAHLPKLKAYKDKSNGELVERKPHVHIIIPKVNLLTGQSISFQEKYNVPYLDAFQEYINCKYGLESPKDNRRTDFNSKSEMISRYKGDLFKGLGKEHKEKILQLIMDKNPRNSREFQNLLLSNSYDVKIRNANIVEKKYINVIPPKYDKGINLKEFVFSDEFLQLDAKEKLQYLQQKNENKNLSRSERIELIEKNKEAAHLYLQEGLARPIPEAYMNKLNEWLDTVSFRRKYIDRSANKTDRAKYKSLTTNKEQKEFLQEKQNDFYNNLGVNYDKKLDRTELGKLITAYRGAIVDNLKSASDNLRIISDNVGRLDSNKISPVNDKWRQDRRDEYARIVGINKGRHISDQVGRDQNKDRRCSVVDTLTLEYINDKVSREELKNELTHFKSTLKADVLLELTEKTHGTIPEKYKISINKDGSERIKCGNNNYSVVDFCIKELNLDWNESFKILRTAELMQREIDREQGWSIHDDKYLAKEYKKWLVDFKAAKDTEFTKLQSEIKSKYEEIKTTYKVKTDELKIRSDIGYHKKGEEYRLLKMERLLENRALSAARSKEYEQIKSKYNLDMQESYQNFLISKAELGDDRALLELKRLRVDFEEYKKSGAIRHVDRYKEYKLNISHQIDKNGVITYKMDYYSEKSKTYLTREVIKDIGKRIEVLNKEDSNIKLALDLALLKYGRHLELFGSKEFRKQLVELSIKENYKVTFKDKFSESYRKELVSKMQKEHDHLEENTNLFLKEDLKQKRNLLVVNIDKVDTLDPKGKYVKATKVTLFDVNTKKEYQMSNWQLAHLIKVDKIHQGDMITIDADKQNKISINPYFWNKYISDLQQGVIITDLKDDKLTIELPTWRQAKYTEKSFQIESSNLVKTLESMGYTPGDLVSIKPSINLENKTIDYAFTIIGAGPDKLQAKKEILEVDIQAAKVKFCSENNINQDELSKEICGKIIDFGVGQLKGKTSSFIILENNLRKIDKNVLKAKEEFCLKHVVAMHNLSREICGEVLDFGISSFDKSNLKSPQSFYLKLKTPYDEKTLWGKDLERMISANQITKGENIYVAMIEAVNNDNEIKNKFESMKLTDNQMKMAKDFTTSLYTRYWNEQFKELMDKNQLVRNESVFIAKVGENILTEKFMQRDFVATPINIALVKQELDSAKDDIIIKHKLAEISKFVAGQVVEYGIGKFNENSAESYFIKLKDFEGGIQTLWGKDLERLVKEESLTVGQYAYIAKITDKDLGYGKIISQYDVKMLNQISEQIKLNNHETIDFNKTVIGTVIDCGTRTIKGNKQSFIKFETITGQKRTYWDKDLNDIVTKLKKNDTVYFGQVQEQQLIKEIKQDKFNVALVANDLDIRAIELIKQRERQQTQELELE